VSRGVPWWASGFEPLTSSASSMAAGVATPMVTALKSRFGWSEPFYMVPSVPLTASPSRPSVNESSVTVELVARLLATPEPSAVVSWRRRLHLRITISHLVGVLRTDAQGFERNLYESLEMAGQLVQGWPVDGRVAHAKAPGDARLGTPCRLRRWTSAQSCTPNTSSPRVAGSTRASVGTWASPRKSVQVSTGERCPVFSRRRHAGSLAWSHQACPARSVAAHSRHVEVP